MSTPNPAQDAPYRSLWTDLMSATFTQSWIDAGGVRTRYAQAGRSDRPALIMIHGTAGSWETFSANLEEHAKHFNCFALDLVGSGLSDKPDKPYHVSEYVKHVAAFMQALGLKRASFIGVSLGSWVAARFALTHPDRTDKLVLISPAGLHSDAAAMQRIKSQRGNAAEDPSWDKVKGVFDRLILDPRNRIPDLVAVRQRIYRLEDMRRSMQNILVLQDPEHRSSNVIPLDEWRQLSAPALLIAAVDADDVYLKTAKDLRTILPNARYCEMRGVSHWAHFEDPAQFNRASVDFLQSAGP